MSTTNSIAMPLKISIDYRTLHQQLMMFLQHLGYKVNRLQKISGFVLKSIKNTNCLY